MRDESSGKKMLNGNATATVCVTFESVYGLRVCRRCSRSLASRSAEDAVAGRPNVSTVRQ